MAGAGEGAVVERREARRQKGWPGLIRLGDGTEIPCVVRDVSKSGAKLVLPSARTLSRTFLLRIDARGVALRVSLAWRRGGSCGVRIEKIARLRPGKHNHPPATEDASRAPDS